MRRRCQVTGLATPVVAIGGEPGSECLEVGAGEAVPPGMVGEIALLEDHGPPVAGKAGQLGPELAIGETTSEMLSCSGSWGDASIRSGKSPRERVRVTA